MFSNRTKSYTLFLIMGISLALGMLPIASVWAAGDIYYVDANVSGGSENGTSWANAFDHLQDALEVAVEGDEIWVAAGVYKPTKRLDSGDGRSVTFLLIEGVEIYGGFGGTESTKTERDWEANLTVLSGDIDNNDTGVGSNGGVTATFDDVQGNNAYSVIVGDPAITYTVATVLDGFTVTGGKTKGNSTDGGISDGAGLRFLDFASPTLANLHIVGNYSEDDGGGIHFRHDNDPVFKNVTIESNYAGDFGGGIFFHNRNNPTYQDVTIIDTNARYASGIYMHENNTADFVNLYVCRNSSNNSNANGNGNAGTGISFASFNDVSVTNAVFAANHAGEDGAAIRMRGNNTFNFDNVSIGGNQASDGGGIYIREPGNTVNVTNSILWGNSSEIDNSGSASINVSYSIVGSGGAYAGTGNVASSTSPFSADPTNGLDNTWGTADDTCGDLNLLQSSAAVDTGKNDQLPNDVLDIDGDNDTAETLPLDLDGNFRISNDDVDMGAYETATARVDQTISILSPTEGASGSIGDGLTISATSTSGLPVVVESLTTNVCTVSSDTLSLLATGDCILEANQDGDDQYNPALPISRTITVLKATQTITFTSPADNSSAVIDDVVDLAASASSGLDVEFTNDTPLVCAINGDVTQVTMLTAGTCTLIAAQAGNDVYRSASSVTHSIDVAKKSQTITFAHPSSNASVPEGALLPLSATADSGLTVNVAVTTPFICSINDENELVMLSAGICGVLASQAGDDNYAPAANVTHEITIFELETQTITFSAPADQDEVDRNNVTTLTATASSGLPVTFSTSTPSVCLVSGSLAIFKDFGACELIASQAGNDVYLAAADVLLTIYAKKEQALTFPDPTTNLEIKIGDSILLTAEAESGLAVTYTSLTPSVCTVSGNSVETIDSGVCEIEATQSGDEAWQSASPQTLSFTVAQDSHTIFLPMIQR